MLIDEFLPPFDFSEHHSIAIGADSGKVYNSIRNLNFNSSAITKFLFKLRGLSTNATSLDGLRHMGCIQFLTPKDFFKFKTPSYAKAVWNFTLSETSPGVTALATETRILCLDKTSLMYFRLYWFFVQPFSGMVRNAVLRSIKRQFEGPAS